MWILFHINKNYLSKILYYPKEYLTANQNTFIRKNNKNTKSASIGFTQSIFESGGIGFKMDYADNRFKYEMLSWENQNSQLIYTIYNTLLDMKVVEFTEENVEKYIS